MSNLTKLRLAPAKRGSVPSCVTLLLFLLTIASSGIAARAEDVPKVKGSDHRGLAIGSDAESYVRDLPSGAHVDRNLAHGTGYSGHQIDDMARLAREENVIIGARSTNVDSMRHIRDGRAVPKPLEVKSKTITKLDTYLGASPQDQGLVGYFKPKKPNKADVPAELWNDVQQRYKDRLKEHGKLRDSVNKLVSEGKVVEKNGKIYAAVKNADGTRDLKPFAGDIDAVYFKDATTGEYLTGDRYRDVKNKWMGVADKSKPDSFLDRFKRTWNGDKDAPDYWSKSGAPGQHGAETNLVDDLTEGLKKGTPEYDRALAKAEELHGSLADNHWKKGEVVLEMQPDGNLRRGSRFSKDTPLPNLHGQGAADDLARAAGKSDDLARAAGKSDDLARAAGALDDVPTSGIRGALGKGATTLMEGIGRLGAGYDVYSAGSQLNDYFDAINKARDPNTSDEEAAEAFAKAQDIANALAEAGIIGAISEAYPPAAAVLGVWTVTRHGGEWILENTETGQRINRATEEYLGRHVTAWDRFWGKNKQNEANRRRLCQKMRAAVLQKRVALRGSFDAGDVCDAIMRGDSIGDMIETAAVSPDEVEVAPKQEPEIALIPPSCDASQNQKTIGGLRKAADKGNSQALAHITHLQGVNSKISTARTAIDAARPLYAGGDTGGARASLNRAKTLLEGFGGSPDCSALSGSISEKLDKIDRLERVLSAARDAIDSCSPEAVRGVKARFGEMKHSAVRGLIDRADAVLSAEAIYQEARATYSAGDLSSTKASLTRAKSQVASLGDTGCSALAEKIDAAMDKVERLRNAINSAEQAVVSCDTKSIGRWRAALANVNNPAASAVKSQLEKSDSVCQERLEEERLASATQSCRNSFGANSYAAANNQRGGELSCYCKPGFNWNTGQTRCVEAPSEGQLAADRNRYCKDTYGPGYYGGPVRADGKYYCLPTQATANNWCNANNPGSGWKAGKIKSDGSYNCNRSPAVVRKVARADCRRQARQMGKVYGATSFDRNGNYTCHWCERGYRYKGGRCYSRQRQPTINPAAGAAAVSGIIDALQRQQARKNRPDPRRVAPRPQPQRWPQQPASPAQCIKNGMINMTDVRCKKYW